MRHKIAGQLASAIFAGLIALAPHPVPAQDLHGEIETIVKDYLAAHPDEVGEIVKGYFVKHPEAVGQILAEILKQRRGASARAHAAATAGAVPTPSTNPAADRSAAVAGNAAQLFSSTHQV